MPVCMPASSLKLKQSSITTICLFDFVCINVSFIVTLYTILLSKSNYSDNYKLCWPNDSYIATAANQGVAPTLVDGKLRFDPHTKRTAPLAPVPPP